MSAEITIQGGPSNLGLFSLCKKDGLACDHQGRDLTAACVPSGECQLLTSCDAGDDSDEEDSVLRGAEAERYSRVSVWLWSCPYLTPCPWPALGDGGGGFLCHFQNWAFPSVFLL